MKIGLISDTHGLLRPKALDALQGCDHILHAGDIGKPEILDALGEIAPLSAVRGNNDEGLDWATELPESLELDLAGVRLFMVHDAAHLPGDLAARGIHVAVCGHSHKPLVEPRAGLLLVNPGSAGPRRFKLPICLALLHLQDGQIRVEHIDLI